jgi:hypothetical protein
LTATINREHPEYASRKTMWRRYRDLYAGGEQLREHASEYLARRHKEPNEIYVERLSRVFYQNYIGSIVDWYAATLMRRAPVVTYDSLGASAKRFYAAFSADCDFKGTNLTDFFRQGLVETLVCGSTYIVVDFPRGDGPAATRAEEDASGRSRAFLVNYGPDEVINWSHDSMGQLDWVVIRTACLQQSDVTDSKWERETRWIYYDRQTFKVFRQTGESKPIELLDQGKHGFATLNRVPVFRMKVSEGLWLTNKAALLQLEHFNKSNALAWALTMGLFATPVIYSDREWSQIVGESYYIQMGPQDRFGWTEPEGKVYQIAADNLVKLRDEIYRVCYLLTQVGDASGGARQSALSKQLDFEATEEVLRAYGDAVKETMRRVLGFIAEARQDGVGIQVAGLDEFDIDDFGSELQNAKSLLSLGIQSPTLTKQVLTTIALKYLNDAPAEIKNKVAEEIKRGDG